MTDKKPSIRSTSVMSFEADELKTFKAAQTELKALGFGGHSPWQRLQAVREASVALMGSLLQRVSEEERLPRLSSEVVNRVAGYRGQDTSRWQ